VVVFVLAALGVKTYIDISTYIEDATQTQIEAARARADELLASFAAERDQALSDFQAQVQEVIDDLKRRGDQAIADIESHRDDVIAEIDARALVIEPGDPSLSVRTVLQRDRNRPIGPGLSISSLQTTAGTICCVVRSRADGRFYLLTAYQVVVSEEDLELGPGAAAGGIVIQPGAIDGGDADDAVATVADYPTFDLGPGAERTASEFDMAGAIALIDEGIEYYSDVPEIGPITGVSDMFTVGDDVVAYGRTSGVTRGVVTAINASINITLNAGGATRRFVDMIVVSRDGQSITQGGDLGAPVLNAGNELIGIAFAGSAQATIVMPIGPILEAFDVEIVTGGPTEG